MKNLMEMRWRLDEAGAAGRDYRLGKPEPTRDRTGWIRYDVNLQIRGQATREAVHVVDGSDLSAPYAGRDDPNRCGWCYLGASHSEKAHEAKLRAG